MFMDIDKVQKAFVDGTGLGWHEHHPSLFSGTERFFRAGYNANLEAELDPGARRHGRPAARRRARRRCRLRLRRFDDRAREGLPEVDVRRL
jgi:hypothetical protein